MLQGRAGCRHHMCGAGGALCGVQLLKHPLQVFSFGGCQVHDVRNRTDRMPEQILPPSILLLTCWADLFVDLLLLLSSSCTAGRGFTAADVRRRWRFQSSPLLPRPLSATTASFPIRSKHPCACSGHFDSVMEGAPGCKARASALIKPICTCGGIARLVSWPSATCKCNHHTATCPV